MCPKVQFAFVTITTIELVIADNEFRQESTRMTYRFGVHVHGAWNHDRSVKVILYSFYKNICLYIIELWFAIFSAWSGQTIFERWTIGLFNVIFTAWPPVVLGLFDRPIAADQMMRYPSLYHSFQKRSFSIARFLLWIGMALVHSLSLFFLSYGFLETQVVWASGETGGWLMLGNSAYSFVVATVCLKALLECDSWTWPVVVASIGSIVLWLLFLCIYAAVSSSFLSFCRLLRWF
ncbi:hypothetical protein ANCDUO_20767 [Ancylostoma duodenale]|uniref:P-type ATPase C-terminal domain-containing protein n=1 Tax=Ancylostoma duodenale TaxID=51022 RepID=A0A0C2FR36_9BILA|nr:hypothetical protein ANCDUO_20767 [Ancylostoma duodenale]